MYVSELIYTYLETYERLRAERDGGYVSPEEAECTPMLELGFPTTVVSDYDESNVSVRDAFSVYGRNYRELNTLQDEGKKDEFVEVCKAQLKRDAEYEAKKESK